MIKAREEAIKIVSNDPDLKENIVLRNILIDNSDNKFIHDFLNWKLSLKILIYNATINQLQISIENLE